MGDGGRTEFGHLLPAVVPILSLSMEERVSFASQDRWIDYPAARTVLCLLDDVLNRQKSIRNKGRLVAARSNNGKSALLDRFARDNPPTTLENGDVSAPVVLMLMPDEPSEAKFWSALLQAMRIPHRSGDATRHQKATALNVLRVMNTRMLMIDEIHNLLEGSAKQMSHAVAMLKSISNEISIPIVAAGTERAITALGTDEQTATRFHPVGLPPWERSKGLQSFLAGMEAVLPLAEPSNLTTREMLEPLLAKSTGTIGGLVTILQEATILALRAKREKLDVDLVNAVRNTTLASLRGDERLRL